MLNKDSVTDYEKNLFRVMRALIYAAVAILVAFLLRIGMSENVRVTVRDSANDVVAITMDETQDYYGEAAPAGVIHEYKFKVPYHLEHDTYLGFYLYHQFADVYIDEENVYRLESTGNLPMIKTPGYNWALIPIYSSDAGKEVSIRITPVYRGADDTVPEFLLGSRSEIIISQLMKSWIKLMICELIIFTGVVLCIFSIYYRRRYHTGVEITGYGVFALCVGLWRYTDTRFSPFMLPNRPVLMFMVSCGVMIIGPIALIISQRRRIKKEVRYWYKLIVSCIAIVSLLLQWCGIIEVRRLFTIFHMNAIISFWIVLVSVYKEGKTRTNTIGRKAECFSLALMIIGATMDAFVFYMDRIAERTIFFNLTFLIYILMASFSYVIEVREKERLIQEKENQLVQSRVGAMMGQIRSHFVFNILNAISGMCKFDPEKADETVVCFARYLRTNIDIMYTDDLVPFRIALRHLEDYFELEQVRFGEQIRFEQDLGVVNFELPPLVLQPLVENAIKHGLCPNGNKGTVTLRTWMEGEQIKISVSDDGVGFDMDSVDYKTKSVGIQNVILRLQYMVNGELTLTSAIGKGTTAVITIEQNPELKG